MKQIKEIKIAIVSSSFRKEVTDSLEKNCLKTFREKGLHTSQVDIFRVPGSLEIPIVVKKLAKKGSYDAIITFGAILKGKTYHFEQIASECIRGCMDASWQHEVPVIFEVLAVYDLQDAVKRATRKEENKGVEAALTALEMIKLLSKI
ncbi:MAG: 6,7-dimethyl-8-ribityllumazine synthase [Candidatus Levybacteria bacterium RIFCSPHIGHO2_12_FULL_38_12]|nr:MAG: 6,7-dimethyl-8-ribityllumazine synthase [Candidatus Levybacteria bacterium RIFCSPHIGHO2_01_FULL_38_12]OGH22259.1 MAG: 6,7-dimethyl-8-ribityllumazine synthase [Candidatus Levybacteria bacterium RIFCSPHIGHO2_02_FULL_37_18]OGH22678.1 MAG: 6,7-dimethyl-8-ribityllumazine synthase [Candidatus Levybacteria bacterium RIFCSPHIGHO2_12_FULL_38_12]OGH33514.1 MAG: 6,7-dimethyl-8-ribityllumazine synthase [Candidatus Levybacteria bacterium RIFCSPLOWO2_01_FULL_37_20]OGH43376.1 MAG: 6,7-dimethyl-8-ribit